MNQHELTRRDAITLAGAAECGRVADRRPTPPFHKMPGVRGRSTQGVCGCQGSHRARARLSP